MSTDMATIERSLHNFSLSSAESAQNQLSLSSDLNSHLSLPYQWEQCLDLKTGEVYYINWRTGMREKEDPRTTVDFYSEGDENEDEDEDEDEDSSYDDSEESSSTEFSPIFNSNDNQILQNDIHHNNNNNNKSGVYESNKKKEGGVVVVAGCKSCLMYFMVSKQDSVCLKCCGQLLHFDQSKNGTV